MTAGNNTALVTAAQQRARDTRRRAVEALRRLDAAGHTVTFTSVTRAAGVSRSWLYRQPDLCTEIHRLRTSGTVTTAVPSAQRASTESLRRRLEATLDEIQRLKAENHQLREEVARRFGQQRVDGPTRKPVKDMSST
jgi:hypothetical protein